MGDGYARQTTIFGNTGIVEKQVARRNTEIRLWMECEASPFLLERLRYNNDMQVCITASGKCGDTTFSHRAVEKLVVVNDQEFLFRAGIARNQGGKSCQIFWSWLAEFRKFLHNAVFGTTEQLAYTRPCLARGFPETRIPAHVSTCMLTCQIFT